ncbi:Methylmalonic aciduria and homocystinuria type D protein, mitochondrial [Balamuthia mandrillaris]
MQAEEKSKKREKQQLWVEGWQMEWNLHRCGRRVWRELEPLWPSVSGLPREAEVVLAAVWQRAANDMSGYSFDTTEERDKLSAKFVKHAQLVCRHVKEKGHWADFIDPSSGIPFFGEPVNTVFMETDEVIGLLGYDILELGCCKVVSHAAWGTFATLAVFVTTASSDVLEEAIKLASSSSSSS